MNWQGSTAALGPSTSLAPCFPPKCLSRHHPWAACAKSSSPQQPCPWPHSAGSDSPLQLFHWNPLKDLTSGFMSLLSASLGEAPRNSGIVDTTELSPPRAQEGVSKGRSRYKAERGPGRIGAVGQGKPFCPYQATSQIQRLLLSMTQWPLHVNLQGMLGRGSGKLCFHSIEEKGF